MFARYLGCLRVSFRTLALGLQCLGVFRHDVLASVFGLSFGTLAFWVSVFRNIEVTCLPFAGAEASKGLESRRFLETILNFGWLYL